MADFNCAICLSQAEEPVVTRCGHLFCWSCLDEWLSRPGVEDCPVCKGRVRRDETGDIIPLYGKGRRSEHDSRPSAPAEATTKPTAPRTEAASPPPEARPGAAAGGAAAGAGAGAGGAAHHERPRAPRAPTPPPRARNGFQHVRNRLPIFSGVLFLGFSKEILFFYIIMMAAYAVPWQRVWAWVQAHVPPNPFIGAANNNNNNANANGPNAAPPPQQQQQQQNPWAAREEQQQARAAQAERDQTADAIRRRIGLDAHYVDYIVGCALVFSVIAWYTVMAL